MNRYLLKVNGVKHCPDGNCYPETSAQWEGGEVLIPADGPVWFDGDVFQPAPEIGKGDEVWIWTHEYSTHGAGWGLTARARVTGTRPSGGFLAVQIEDVDRLLHPFGFLDLDKEPDASSFLGAISARRNHRAWYMDEASHAEVASVINARAANTPATPQEEVTKRSLNWQKQRPVQGRFRKELLERYDGICVITGCSTPQALEAAHVLPHDGSAARDDVANGLLLRRDLHRMFDALLWSIDPYASTVRLSKRIDDPTFEDLDGIPVDHSIASDNLLSHFKAFLDAEKNV